MSPTSRFDYVAYDDTSREIQALFKEQFERLEFMVLGHLSPSWAQSLILTHLEDAYAWVGKAVRDEQIARGAPAPLQEGRDTS